MGREPLAVVRIRVSDFALAWLEAVSELLAAIEQADPEITHGAILDATTNVRAVMWASARDG